MRSGESYDEVTKDWTSAAILESISVLLILLRSTFQWYHHSIPLVCTRLTELLETTGFHWEGGSGDSQSRLPSCIAWERGSGEVISASPKTNPQRQLTESHTVQPSSLQCDCQTPTFFGLFSWLKHARYWPPSRHAIGLPPGMLLASLLACYWPPSRHAIIIMYINIKITIHYIGDIRTR